MNPSAAAAGYLAIAEALHAATCATNAAIDKDPDSLPVLQEAFAGTAEALDTAATELSDLPLPADLEPPRATLVNAFTDSRDAATAVSEAKTFEAVDKVYPAFETAVAALGAAGKALRAGLLLPPGPADC